MTTSVNGPRTGPVKIGGDAPDLTACDREPIHIPGAIQPHGAMLAMDAGGVIRAASGRTLEFFGSEPEALLDRQLNEIFEDPFAGVSGFAGQVQAGGHDLDLTRHPSGDLDLLEFEPRESAPLSGLALLQALETVTQSLDQADSVEDLCDRAAGAFRRLTGFDRAMVYRFLDDGAGRVLGESRRADLPSFMNHHFPASDIPRQARALYLRNLIRVIPDAAYTPSPILARGIEPTAIDLSDSVLRSVSPVHLEYLRNMGVAASASVSIVVDGQLWGLAALHNMEPRRMPHETRAVCRVLAGVLARRLKHFADLAEQGERGRLEAVRAAVVADLAREGGDPERLADQLIDLMDAAAADGVALSLPDRVVTLGSTPPAGAIPSLRDWSLGEARDGVFASASVSSLFPPAADYDQAAAGLLAIDLGAACDGAAAVLWFRAEQVQEVRWAGDPHKAAPADPEARLNPRTSFEEWKQTVRGQSRPWNNVHLEAARRLRAEIIELDRRRRLSHTAETLTAAVADRDQQLEQKDFLLKEVNHRIQNNLQLVASFLSLQRRETTDPQTREHLDDAMRRMRAVGLVHRRLYASRMVEAVEMDRYLTELVEELIGSLGPEWRDLLSLEAESTEVPTDRAVAIGLVLTELVINVAKYAYEGRPGPVQVGFGRADGELVLTVADQGRGRSPGAVPAKGGGFGTRMMMALVAQLGGSLSYADNNPGARAVLTAPV
ncbi:MAG: GAF domain-containing protein [Caulobacteraceae bacterium]|nr:GAF domain-containing protein [Caulobacteraceae bacterium]